MLASQSIMKIVSVLCMRKILQEGAAAAAANNSVFTAARESLSFSFSLCVRFIRF